MRRFYYLFLIVILILCIQINSSCRYKNDSTLFLTPTSVRYISGEIIVRFKTEAFNEDGELISESIKALNAKYGLISMEPLFKTDVPPSLAHIYKLKFPEKLDIIEAVQEYAEDPSVVYAEPNYTMHTIREKEDAD